MNTPTRTTRAPRPTASHARLFAILIPLVLSGLLGGTAHAQGGREIVGGPITTARFERLLRLFVQPTTAEMTALDRLHEQYLERFRTEVEPEIDKLSADTGAGFPSKSRFDRLMRDLDRVGARISDADNAFFAAAAEAVAEPRRDGINRLKAARERQRLLSGVAKWVPGSFGQGAAFVDIADMLARDRFARQVPTDAREQFNSFLALQESRLLTQARALHDAARDGMERLYDVSAAAMAVEAPAIPPNATPEQQARLRAEAARRAGERMRAISAAMDEIGRPIRKILRSNHNDNRIACGQLAPILGRVTADEFRELAATRALGGEAYAFGMSMGDNIALASVAKRLRRDPQVPEEGRVRIDEGLARWRGERASALEAFLTVIDDSKTNSVTARLATTGDAEDQAAADEAAALDSARDVARGRLEAADAQFQALLVSMLGERVERYFERVESDEGAGAAPQFVVRSDEPSEEDAWRDDVAAGAGQGNEFGYVEPIEKLEVLFAFKIAGAPISVELAEATYDAWLSGKWEAKVGPLNERYRQAQDSSYEYTDNRGIAYKPQEFAKMAEAARAMAGAVCDADRDLVADLGGALGLTAESPGLMLVRLAAIRRLSEVGDGDEFEAHTPALAHVLELAGATPDEVARVIAEGKDGWMKLADDVRPAMDKLAALDEREGALQMKSSARTEAAVKEFTAQYEALGRERAALQRTIRDQFGAVYDAACKKAIDDPDRLGAFLRARVRATYPEIYSPDQSAEHVLTAALALRDIDEDLRAKIDALRAEYIVVFDDLSARILAITEKASAENSDDWTEYTRQMQAADNLRFRRDERTAKAMGELRRLLGPAGVARVPGLAEKEEGDDGVVDPFEDED